MRLVLTTLVYVEENDEGEIILIVSVEQKRYENWTENVQTGIMQI